MSQRIKLVLAYFGRPFHGWQRQRDRRTVQGEVEKALAKFAGGRPPTVSGAGRTDAGVHAAGQVAHVDLPSPVPADAVMRTLNTSLPPDIRIRRAVPVGTSFDARKSALGKLYVYRVRWRANELPWSGLRSVQVDRITHPEALASASRRYVGRHDWASFTVPYHDRLNTVRWVHRFELRWHGKGLDIACVGDGFLRYQVRRMVGLLLEIGGGKRGPEDVEALLSHPRPGAQIKTAPAAGLCLERVYYRRSPALNTTPANDP